MLSKHTCKRCGHTWVPRTENPGQCPKCRSSRWNVTRRGATPGPVPKRAIINISDVEMREFTTRGKPYDENAVRVQIITMSAVKQGLEDRGYAVTVHVMDQMDSSVEISDMSDDAANDLYCDIVEQMGDFDAVEIDEEVREEIEVMTS